ncbi:MAG: DUF3261 domain-containing protein [Kiritimatiellae bacterium]|nr:DUF3261 domain-containing protein [Kiritimatiellia bacterium]
MIRLSVIGTLIVLLSGCATKLVRQTPDNIPVTEALLSGVTGTTLQSVSGAWKDESFSAECVLKGDGRKLTVVLLAPQMRLATLTIEKPHTIRWERVPQLPSSLDPEYVIFDLALVLLPTDRLKTAIGKDYRIEETADGKRRSVADVKTGSLKSVRQILANGDVYFRNVVHGYEFTVKTVANEN